MLRYILPIVLVVSLNSVSEAQLFKRLRGTVFQPRATVQGSCDIQGNCATPNTAEWSETITTSETAPKASSNTSQATYARYTTEELRRLIQDAPEVPYVGVRGMTVYQHLVDPEHGFTWDQVRGLSSADAYRLHSLAPNHANLVFPTYRVAETPSQQAKAPVRKPEPPEEQKIKDVSIWIKNTESPKSIWLVSTP